MVGQGRRGVLSTGDRGQRKERRPHGEAGNRAAPHEATRAAWPGEIAGWGSGHGASARVQTERPTDFRSRAASVSHEAGSRYTLLHFMQAPARPAGPVIRAHPETARESPGALAVLRRPQCPCDERIAPDYRSACAPCPPCPTCVTQRRRRGRSLVGRAPQNRRPCDLAPMQGQRSVIHGFHVEGLCRVRVSDHRIVSAVQDDVLLDLVVRIGQRSDVCKAMRSHPLGRCPPPTRVPSANCLVPSHPRKQHEHHSIDKSVTGDGPGLSLMVPGITLMRLSEFLANLCRGRGGARRPGTSRSRAGSAILVIPGAHLAT